MPTMVEFKCPQCEEVKLYPKKIATRKKFCSRACFAQSISQKTEIHCDTCGNSIMRKPSDVKKNNFCCKECHDKFMTGKTRNEKKRICFSCLNCGVKVSVFPSRYYRGGQPRKFCTRECSYEYQKKIFVSSAIEVSCDNCGEKILRTPAHIKQRNYCNYNCMAEHYSREQLFAGENSPTWGGGKKSYYGPNWHEQRRRCREREGYTCKDCGITEQEYGQELSVHHLIPFVMFDDDYESANELDNLVAICEPCHRIRHSGDNHPTKFNIRYK
jgi:5-methylcytosine-specific restriction endonuclease McrA